MLRVLELARLHELLQRDIRQRGNGAGGRWTGQHLLVPPWPLRHPETVGPCRSALARGPTARASAGHVMSSSASSWAAHGWRGVAGGRTTQGRFRQARPEHVRRVRALLCSLAEPARARNATRAEHKRGTSIRCSGANRQRRRRRPREHPPCHCLLEPLFSSLGLSSDIQTSAAAIFRTRRRRT